MIGGHIVPAHAMAKQLPLSQDVLWTRQSPVVCFICLSGLPRRLRLAKIATYVSLLHANQKNPHTEDPSPPDSSHSVKHRNSDTSTGASAALEKRAAEQ